MIRDEDIPFHPPVVMASIPATEEDPDPGDSGAWAPPPFGDPLRQPRAVSHRENRRHDDGRMPLDELD